MQQVTTAEVAEPAASRIAVLDWRAIGADLDAHGCAVLSGLLDGDDCAALTAMYADEGLFRSRVVMSRHGFGRGEYKYFAYPLPAVVASLRTGLYPPLAGIANLTGGWAEYLEEPGHAAGIYDRIFSGIERRYILTYYPTNTKRDGKLRRVEIKVRNHADYIILGKKSYYAESQ